VATSSRPLSLSLKRTSASSPEIRFDARLHDAAIAKATAGESGKSRKR
jgi:hypothetical protein